ncbi:MAG: GumC family protein [Flavobacteriales bacterium]
MKETTNFEAQVEENEALNIREEIDKYVVYWRWFILGLIVALLAAFVYLRYTPAQYNAISTILIKDNQKSGISDELKAVADLGIVGTGSTNNTDNEIEVIKSRKIIARAIDSLDLMVTYFTEGRVIQTEIYEARPIKLSIDVYNTVFSESDTTFIFKHIDKTKFSLSSFDRSSTKEYQYNGAIHSNLGLFSIHLTNAYSKNLTEEIFIKVTNRSKVIDSYRSRVSISPISKNSSVLTLSINDIAKEKAVDFLDELVNQYNIDAIHDKNEVSEKTRDFIDDRLSKISLDLESIQNTVKDFKSKHNITGLSTEGELVLAEAAKNNQKLVELNIQLTLAEGLLENLSTAKYETLPSNLGFSDKSIPEYIIEFNKLVAEKNRLSVSAGQKNPLLMQAISEIEVRRRNLIESINNLISSTKVQIRQVRKVDQVVKNKVSSIPVLERGIIDIERQQRIISELYSYLLKKKEETAISLAVTVPNAKIIDAAYSSGVPVSPKKKIVYLAAFIIGILIPFIFIYLKYLLDTKVHNRKDIEDSIDIPFIGDIPKSGAVEKIVVGSAKRSSAAEAFRLIRTNVDFILSTKQESNKVIFITSTTSGEGKSFISINVAATLAMSNKKVLLLGMDLRAPKVTKYLGVSNQKGVTNYVTDHTLSLNDLKFKIPEAPNLDIIASGAIPPNPAELLMTSKVEAMFDTLKADYDYIVVDTAPVNLVTDTLLLAKYADMFMYVVRANYLDKRLLAVPKNLYNEKRLPNMAIVLNDTDPKRSYGYGYGGYGYGGYGYGEDEKKEEKKPWYKKMFS